MLHLIFSKWTLFDLFVVLNFVIFAMGFGQWRILSTGFIYFFVVTQFSLKLVSVCRLLRGFH